MDNQWVTDKPLIEAHADGEEEEVHDRLEVCLVTDQDSLSLGKQVADKFKSDNIQCAVHSLLLYIYIACDRTCQRTSRPASHWWTRDRVILGVCCSWSQSPSWETQGRSIWTHSPAYCSAWSTIFGNLGYEVPTAIIMIHDIPEQINAGRDGV